MCALLPLLVVVVVVSGAPVQSKQAAARPGFSRACRGPRTIARMVEEAEVVTEAVVVAVSPPRDGVYAVTLQTVKVSKYKLECSSHTIH